MRFLSHASPPRLSSACAAVSPDGRFADLSRGASVSPELEAVARFLSHASLGRGPASPPRPSISCAGASPHDRSADVSCRLGAAVLSAPGRPDQGPTPMRAGRAASGSGSY
ncbi:hypothetical protein GALLR39Z86_38340 [Glycomyces algeriensis]|uniref:Uncharacterized protein n=1 Tax=Glycomyces algeriensis TaxID=256037 RepID=A0A9W6G9T4_9ACTN|nr:hypothetical protein GALLR39Z86_38340 [Glycomyces algeriensis]